MIPQLQKSEASTGLSRRPRLLFLSQCLPYPPDGGVKIRTYNILRLLSSSFDVTALCFYRWKRGVLQPDVEASLSALGRFADVRAFPIPQEHSRPRLLWDHLRSVCRARTYTIYSYESAHFRAALERAMSEKVFDVVHSDSLDLSGYFPLVADLPIVCTHHDATSVLLRRRGDVNTSRLQRSYLRHQAVLMEREERHWCGRVALNVAVSAKDAATLQSIAPAGRFAVVPNGVDTDYFRPQTGSDNGLICVGGTTWFPNRDALEFFSADVLPALRRLGENPAVHWVGRASPDEIERYRRDHDVRLTGYVADVRPHIRHATCYIVPIRVGGGTRIKILDAWAMGKAVVSTSIGCEGLDAVDGGNILIRDDPEEFAGAIRNVLQDRSLRERLGREGRKTVETTYSWEVIGEGLREQYYQYCSST